MRKFLIPLMAASMLVPVAAQAREPGSDRGNRDRPERSERSSSNDRPQRAERPARSERAERPERPARPERAERPERVERSERVQRERQPRIDRSVEREPRQVQRVEQVRPDPRNERIERADGVLGGLRSSVRQQQERRAVETRRDRDGFDGLHDRIVEHGRRVDRDRDHRRDWSRDWRHDHRYDWRSHRNYHRTLFRLGRYYDPYGWGYRRFSIGFSLWPSYYGSSFWLDDPWMYRLPPAYGPYRWVRYYDDALLVNIYSGEVVDVVYNVFW